MDFNIFNIIAENNIVLFLCASSIISIILTIFLKYERKTRKRIN